MSSLLILSGSNTGDLSFLKRKRERFPLFNDELLVTLHDLKRLQNHVRIQKR